MESSRIFIRGLPPNLDGEKGQAALRKHFSAGGRDVTDVYVHPACDPLLGVQLLTMSLARSSLNGVSASSVSRRPRKPKRLFGTLTVLSSRHRASPSRWRNRSMTRACKRQRRSTSSTVLPKRPHPPRRLQQNRKQAPRIMQRSGNAVRLRWKTQSWPSTSGLFNLARARPTRSQKCWTPRPWRNKTNS